MGRLVIRWIAALAVVVAVTVGAALLGAGGQPADAAPGHPTTTPTSDPTAGAPPVVTTSPPVTTAVPTTRAVTTTKASTATTVTPPRKLPRVTTTVPQATTTAPPPITFPPTPTEPPTVPLPAVLTDKGEGHVPPWPAGLSIGGIVACIAILGGGYYRARSR